MRQIIFYNRRNFQEIQMVELLKLGVVIIGCDDVEKDFRIVEIEELPREVHFAVSPDRTLVTNFIPSDSPEAEEQLKAMRNPPMSYSGTEKK